ncbi:MAG: signal peptidase II [Candidatus Eremiobacteraeota bacterium]|nr:signal peptidase II [Candidatus Eremiobacteraeota bacterium]
MSSIPSPGDEIYVDTSLYLSHGVDDVRGGRATVVRVETETLGGRPVPFVAVAEHPGSLYNWEHLAEKQTELAARFGEARARPDPDMRPQFNDDMMTEQEREATYEQIPPRAGSAPASARATAPLVLVALVAIIVFALDRWTKSIVLQSFLPGESRLVVPRLLWWTYVQNTHGAFGLFGNSPLMLIVLALLVLGVFSYAFRDQILVRHRGPADRQTQLVRVAFGMIVGGALGNIVDRFQHQWVVDFIDFKPIWGNVFNVADASITVGVALLVMASLRREKPA